MAPDNLEDVLQDIRLYGIVNIKGFYLPFAFMAVTMLMGGKPEDLMSDVRGILVGHLWYFFTTLLPKGTGKVYLRTPRWVKYLADKLELTTDGPAAAPRRAAPGFRMPSAAAVAAGRPGGSAQAAAGSAGFQAFRGSGNRLGGS
jgi:Derlin-2/3